MLVPRPARPSPPTVLSARALNRALLARQHLLERSPLPAARMIEHLVGMQAQNPLDPYTALWSRLEAFDPAEVAGMVERREAVRLGLLRTTLHLVTANDAMALWPALAPVSRAAWQGSSFAKQLREVDVEAVVEAARARLADAPATIAELRGALATTWPDTDATSLAYAARFLLPIVQLPPRGVWGRTGRPTWTTIEAWLGGPVEPAPDLDRLILRYLAAFGPATVSDARTWSWLTGLRAVFERLRPQLRTFRDEAGRELFDLPDAPRPDPDTPAPPRFLPEYDNLVLSHQDRRRVVPPGVGPAFGGFVGTFLVDGFAAGQWRIDASGGGASLILEPFGPLADPETPEIVNEGERLLAFHRPSATDRRVTFGVARRPTGRRRPNVPSS